jgi:hypothetical protein
VVRRFVRGMDYWGNKVRFINTAPTKDRSPVRGQSISGLRLAFSIPEHRDTVDQKGNPGRSTCNLDGVGVISAKGWAYRKFLFSLSHKEGTSLLAGRRVARSVCPTSMNPPRRPPQFPSATDGQLPREPRMAEAADGLLPSVFSPWRGIRGLCTSSRIQEHGLRLDLTEGKTLEHTITAEQGRHHG